MSKANISALALSKSLGRSARIAQPSTLGPLKAQPSLLGLDPRRSSLDAFDYRTTPIVSRATFIVTEMSNTVIKVEGLSKLYRLGEVGTGSLAHDVNRWWHRVRGKEDPYLKIGQTNDRTRSASRVESRETSAGEEAGVESRESRVESPEGKETGDESQPSTLDARPSTSATPSTLDARPSTSASPSANRPSTSSSTSAKTLDPRRSTLDSPQGSDYVFALRDVSFDVQQGEVLGIIGRNGAGKSTLLKILSRVTVQTTGRIRVKGRIASLLEVGTGFHPELTGRENVYLNGAILGMRKAEIRAKFDEIVDFSGCERYIDTPVKRYSSGMYVRLAFAVAAHLEPEILIVDEVLAVGDAEFQKKCLGKMKDVAGHGRTVIFVSHQIPSVTRLCNKVMWMDKGRIKDIGNSLDICGKYLSEERPVTSIRKWDDTEGLPGNAFVRLHSVAAISEENEASGFPISKPVHIEMIYEVLIGGTLMIPVVHFYSSDGTHLFVSHDWHSGWRNRARDVGIYKTCFTVPADFFCEDTISVAAAISSYNPFEVHVNVSDAVFFRMMDDLSESPARGDFAGRLPGVIRPMLDVKTCILK